MQSRSRLSIGTMAFEPSHLRVTCSHIFAGISGQHIASSGSSCSSSPGSQQDCLVIQFIPSTSHAGIYVTVMAAVLALHQPESI